MFSCLPHYHLSYHGRAEAIGFEQPLISIAEWLINNPEADWIAQLNQAAKAPQEQAYAY